jgi:hypothetical protein
MDGYFDGYLMDDWMDNLLHDWMASSSGAGFYNSAFGCFF